MAWVVRKLIVHTPQKALVFKPEQIAAIDFEAKPYIVVAIKNGDGTLTRYMGFPVEIVDEERLIEAPAS